MTRYKIEVRGQGVNGPMWHTPASIDVAYDTMSGATAGAMAANLLPSEYRVVPVTGDSQNDVYFRAARDALVELLTEKSEEVAP